MSKEKELELVVKELKRIKTLLLGLTTILELRLLIVILELFLKRLLLIYKTLVVSLL